MSAWPRIWRPLAVHLLSHPQLPFPVARQWPLHPSRAARRPEQYGIHKKLKYNWRTRQRTGTRHFNTLYSLSEKHR